MVLEKLRALRDAHEREVATLLMAELEIDRLRLDNEVQADELITLRAQVEKLQELLDMTDPVVPPSGLAPWHPDAQPDKWPLRTGYEPPVPGPGGVYRDVFDHIDWRREWPALRDNDVLRILDAEPDSSFVGYGRHFTAGKNPWIWQAPHVKMSGRLESGWAAIDLINCSNINGMGLHSIASDYGVRLSGVQGEPGRPCVFVDCDAVDTRMAAFVVQRDGTNRKGIPTPTLRPSAHVDFYDIAGSGWAGDRPHHSEVLYVSSSKTYSDTTHHIRAFRVHGKGKASEVVEIKPGATDIEIGWVTADDIDLLGGSNGPTGVVSAWVSGSRSTAPYPLSISDPRVNIHHVRTNRTRLHGHGIVTPGFGGITVDGVFATDPDGALVRAWSNRAFTGKDDMADINAGNLYTTGRELVENAHRVGPEPTITEFGNRLAGLTVDEMAEELERAVA